MTSDAPTATVPVLLPELGESVTEGAVVEWRKAVGDTVEAGETLVDVTTDKVDVEIPSPASGVLARIVAEPGATVEVGALLAELTTGDGASPAPSSPAPQATAASGDGGPGTPVEIVLPPMESVTEGTVIAWRKAEGDPVEQDEIVVEVTTDKVDIEVPSPAAGRMGRLLVAEGATFPITQPLGEVMAGASGASAPAAGPAPSAAPSPAGAPAAAPAAGGPEPPASPLARRMAHERGVDLRTVPGTGPGGLIRKGDVRAVADGAVRPAAPAPAVAVAEWETPVALKGPAAALAGYMDESLSIPTATSFRTLGVGLLDARRKQLNDALKAAGRSEKLSFTHIVAWAIVEAVSRWPVMGTGYAVIDGKPHRLDRSVVNLGLAVDVERKDGSRSLLVPVVRDAAALGFAGFVAAYDDIVGRTRTGKIGVDELRGATVTLTNPGGLGTVASLPRLMPGQGTIIATGSIALPVGFQKADAARLAELGVEKVMTMTSTYDHRVIQGAESGGFLREVDQLLSGADGFYEGIAAGLGVPLPAAPAPAAAPAAAPAPRAAAMPAGEVTEEILQAVQAATSVLKAHRTHGHLAAHLDPLGSEPPGDPALDPATVHLTPELMAKVPASILRMHVPGDTFAEALPHLRETYCRTIAYEIEHIASHEQRMWLREMIESGEGRPPLPPERRRAVLERLVDVEVFERFLRRTYLGQKTFSIEGVDAMVPMLDKTVELCADAGAREIVIGMAHRGRLAVMTHTVGRAPESILTEFEGHVEFGSEPEEGVLETAGDVKYHLGADGTFVTQSGRPVTVTLAANPSHLEQVNAVVQGQTRARQTIRKGRRPERDPSVAVPVVVHGDAAFPGQGVVAETLNLGGLAGFTTGGTIHLIANNQIGFTTDPPDSRSTRHASDLAKGFDIPVIHVNADDVDACMAAVHLACAYRREFERDVVIDLIGYRRLGHNEVDEPAYTQPVMSRTIKDHPTVARIYADRLVAEGVMTAADVDAAFAASEARMKAAHEAVTQYAEPGTEDAPAARRRPEVVKTAVGAETLTSLNEQLLRVPDGFTVHPKLVPQLERRRTAVGDGGVTWAHAESLAIASLLVDGVPVRMTGQDIARGTFSQRHLELHDTAEGARYAMGTGEVYTPMANLNRATASFEMHNSPLSEAACVGFEYGYSAQAPEALVLWEAQYGDFANGAQIMIDQFLVSGQAKWGQRSRLTLLLPHGYEGNGPEHSSARPERFLQLCGEGNIRVAICSTADQYFHLIRRQGLTTDLKPLVVFTPKSLLRLRGASCSLEDLTDGEFRAVIDDPRVADRSAVRRLILCTGKVFHELDGHAAREAATDLAVARIELLYPFPYESVRALVESYPNLTDVHWVQEEPRNMGAWEFVSGRIRSQLPEGIELGYVGRDARSSPSEGYPQSHQTEQERIISTAVAGVRAAAR